VLNYVILVWEWLHDQPVKVNYFPLVSVKDVLNSVSSI